MNSQLDKEGIIFAVKFVALVGIIMVTGVIAAHNLVNVASESPYDPLPAYQQRGKPAYQELPQDEFVYSSNSEVMKKQEELIQGKKDFVFANLTDLKLQLYRDGAIALSSPIRARGKKDSLFETPSGYYKIQGKEENHFSTIGHVWMPWSMHFFGNYFIHGWPYYPDGTPVSEAFSGGCIRLGDEDAKQIFNAANVGMPVLVYSGTTTPPLQSTYFKKVEERGSRVAQPVVSAAAVLVADFDTGQVLFEKNSNAIYPIASITKLMAALASVETISRFKVLTITQDALDAPGDSAELIIGETFKAEDLLYPLILTSSNDVAKLLEKENNDLIRTMNQKAKSIGLYDSSFKDASGISAENVSSAQDVFKLLQFLDTSKKPIFHISGLKKYALESLNKKKKHIWTNVNWPPEDDTFLGGKAGKTTAAGETMAGVFQIKFPEFEERPIAIVVLQSENRISDIKNIIGYLAQNFVYGASSLVKTPNSKEGKSPLIREGASVYEAIMNISH